MVQCCGVCIAPIFHVAYSLFAHDIIAAILVEYLMAYSKPQNETKRIFRILPTVKCEMIILHFTE